jgi:hypothetical protein
MGPVANHELADMLRSAGYPGAVFTVAEHFEHLHGRSIDRYLRVRGRRTAARRPHRPGLPGTEGTTPRAAAIAKRNR